MSKRAALRRRMLVVLLFVPGPRGVKAEPIRGVTRLQKLLFLATQETEAKRILGVAYDFDPYRFGPYSAELHDDVEFLESLGLISTNSTIPSVGRDVPDSAKKGKIIWPGALSAIVLKTTQTVPRAVPASDAIESRKDYDFLEGESFDPVLADESEEREFCLTKAGVAHAEEVLGTMRRQDADRLYADLRDIKIKYGKLALRSLLRDVYARYERWTIESEIKHLL